MNSNHDLEHDACEMVAGMVEGIKDILCDGGSDEETKSAAIVAMVKFLAPHKSPREITAFLLSGISEALLRLAKAEIKTDRNERSFSA